MQASPAPPSLLPTTNLGLGLGVGLGNGTGSSNFANNKPAPSSTNNNMFQVLIPPDRYRAANSNNQAPAASVPRRSSKPRFEQTRMLQQNGFNGQNGMNNMNMHMMRPTNNMMNPTSVNQPPSLMAPPPLMGSNLSSVPPPYYGANSYQPQGFGPRPAPPPLMSSNYYGPNNGPAPTYGYNPPPFDLYDSRRYDHHQQSYHGSRSLRRRSDTWSSRGGMDSPRSYSDSDDDRYSSDGDNDSDQSSDSDRYSSGAGPSFRRRSDRSNGSNQSRHQKRRWRKKLNKTVAEALRKANCPGYMEDVMHRTICQELERNKKRGLLSKDYDIYKHNLKENQIRLLEQQRILKQEQNKRELEEWMKTGADGISSLCGLFGIKTLHTDKLSGNLHKKIQDGEFDSIFESVAPQIENTVLKNPLVVLGLKTLRTISDAHHESLEEEKADAEEQEANLKKKERALKQKIKQAELAEQQQQQAERSQSSAPDQKLAYQPPAASTLAKPSVEKPSDLNNQNTPDTTNTDHTASASVPSRKKRGFKSVPLTLGHPSDNLGTNEQLHKMTSSLASMVAPMARMMTGQPSAASKNNQQELNKLSEQLQQPQLDV